MGYQTNQFDNLTVTPTAPATATLAVSCGSGVGRCVDVPGASQTNGTVVALWDCNGGTNQSWTATPSRQLTVYGNKCLDVNGAGTTDGTAVQIYDCSGGTNQQWNINPDGTIVGVGSGKCLDATAHGTTNGTLLQIWTCTGGPTRNGHEADQPRIATAPQPPAGPLPAHTRHLADQPAVARRHDPEPPSRERPITAGSPPVSCRVG
ncbi:RICIN domain-containing protein [Micromonospora sp. M12]